MTAIATTAALTTREALILRELARADGYLAWADLALAAGMPLTKSGQVMVNLAVCDIRRRWGDIIETRAGSRDFRGTYRLTEQGRRLL